MEKNLKFGIQYILSHDYKESNSVVKRFSLCDPQNNIWSNKCKEIFNCYTMANFKGHMSVYSVFPATKALEFNSKSLTDKNKISKMGKESKMINNMTDKTNLFYGPQFSLTPLDTLSKLWINKNCLLACYQELRNKPRKTMLRRSVFSDLQRKGLEQAFKRHPYITKPDRKELAEELFLKDSQVKIWFQNRRMKWRNTRTNEKK